MNRQTPNSISYWQSASSSSWKQSHSIIIHSALSMNSNVWPSGQTIKFTCTPHMALGIGSGFGICALGKRLKPVFRLAKQELNIYMFAIGFSQTSIESSCQICMHIVSSLAKVRDLLNAVERHQWISFFSVEQIQSHQQNA